MGDNGPDLRSLNRPDGMLARGTAAEVIPADNHIAGLAFFHELGVQVFHAMTGQFSRIVGIEISSRNDLIGIDMIAFIYMCLCHNCSLRSSNQNFESHISYFGFYFK